MTSENKIVENKTAEQKIPYEYTAEYWENQLQHSPYPDRRAMYEDLKNRGGGPVMDIFTKYFPKPEKQITPEQARKAKFAAALTDSFAGLAEMFAHGNGARVRNRDGKSSVKTTNQRLQEIQDKYDKDLLQWNAQRYGAETKDFTDLMADEMAKRGEKRSYIYYKANQARAAEAAALKRKQDLEDEARKREQAKEDAKWEIDNIFKTKLDIQDKYDQRQVARRAAYSRRSGSSVSIPVLYNPKDTRNTPKTDQVTGMQFVETQIDREDFDAIVNAAMNDPRYDHLFYKTTPSRDGWSEPTRVPIPQTQEQKLRIVSAYLNDQYNAQWDETPAASEPVFEKPAYRQPVPAAKKPWRAWMYSPGVTPRGGNNDPLGLGI